GGERATRATRHQDLLDKSARDFPVKIRRRLLTRPFQRDIRRQHCDAESPFTDAVRTTMKREILINAGARETRVAILEDEKLVELLVDRPDNRRMVGDIYLGRVEAVLPGIQAAFVDIGTEKSAFLHASDLVRESAEEAEDDDEEETDEAEETEEPTNGAKANGARSNG